MMKGRDTPISLKRGAAVLAVLAVGCLSSGLALATERIVLGARIDAWRPLLPLPLRRPSRSPDAREAIGALLLAAFVGWLLIRGGSTSDAHRA